MGSISLAGDRPFRPIFVARRSPLLRRRGFQSPLCACECAERADIWFIWARLNFLADEAGMFTFAVGGGGWNRRMLWDGVLRSCPNWKYRNGKADEPQIWSTNKIERTCKANFKTYHLHCFFISCLLYFGIEPINTISMNLVQLLVMKHHQGLLTVYRWFSDFKRGCSFSNKDVFREGRPKSVAVSVNIDALPTWTDTARPSHNLSQV